MARIELKNTVINLKDGLSGSAAINQPGTAPVATDTSLTIDTVALNTTVAARVPVGARFTVAGETTATQVHVVTARTQGTGAGVNAKQSVSLDATVPGAPTGGTFTLTFAGKETAALAFDADAATVKAALVALDDGYVAADFAVTGSAGAWVVEFTAALAASPQALLVGDGTSLTGGAGVVTTVTVVTTQVGAAAVATTTTVAITFSPALGAGTYLDDGVITFMPQALSIKIGDGNLTYTEQSEYNYDLDRGSLDTVRSGDEVPMEIALNFVYEWMTTGTSEAIAPMDAIKHKGGAAEWVSSSSDPCEPYCIDVEVIYTPLCGGAQIETTLFPDFRSESREVDFGEAAVSVSGRCNATEPTITRTNQ